MSKSNIQVLIDRLNNRTDAFNKLRQQINNIIHLPIKLIVDVHPTEQNYIVGIAGDQKIIKDLVNTLQNSGLGLEFTTINGIKPYSVYFYPAVYTQRMADERGVPTTPPGLSAKEFVLLFKNKNIPVDNFDLLFDEFESADQFYDYPLTDQEKNHINKSVKMITDVSISSLPILPSLPTISIPSVQSDNKIIISLLEEENSHDEKHLHSLQFVKKHLEQTLTQLNTQLATYNSEWGRGFPDPSPEIRTTAESLTKLSQEITEISKNITQRNTKINQLKQMKGGGLTTNSVYYKKYLKYKSKYFQLSK